jgi:plasmid stabilization system protein ParE
VTRLRIAPEAEEELAQAAEWYEARRPGVGVELVADVDRALEVILAAPLSLPIWRDARPFRRGGLKRFPYVVFYRFADDEVFVVAIAHTKRQPGYWMKRVGPTKG